MMKLKKKWKDNLWGVIFALVPALAVGLPAGFLIGDLYIGTIVSAAVFGLGLEIIFGKPKCLGR